MELLSDRLGLQVNEILPLPVEFFVCFLYCIKTFENGSETKQNLLNSIIFFVNDFTHLERTTSSFCKIF